MKLTGPISGLLFTDVKVKHLFCLDLSLQFLTCKNASGFFLFFIFYFLFLFSPEIHAGNSATDQQQTPASRQQCNAQNIQLQQQNASNKLVPTMIEPLAQPEQVKYKPAYKAVKQYSYNVISRIPHDETAFTQGLAFFDGELYEGTGLLGASEIRKLDIKTGEVRYNDKLDKFHFGEGISIVNNRLIQLTWKTGRAFVYDLEKLQRTGNFSYEGESWGVTTIDEQLLMSDGSATLKWLVVDNDLLSVQVKHLSDIRVSENGVAVQGLNELEYANGFVYANVWPGDCIAQIDPATGNINAWINLTGLYPESSRPQGAAILNGIAYHQGTPYFFVTGKYWPYVYELEFLAP
ncbi:MAG: glutaminyl-peptide cyclotransferase [Gammaproteobacteria bacterium]|nr:glutaminyl-peptide cyclotransferase [Gammaproteobacteria bacterium]